MKRTLREKKKSRPEGCGKFIIDQLATGCERRVKFKLMEEFVGKKVKVETVQEIGWKRPVSLQFGQKLLKVSKVISHWEEHSMASYISHSLCALAQRGFLI